MFYIHMFKHKHEFIFIKNVEMGKVVFIPDQVFDFFGFMQAIHFVQELLYSMVEIFPGLYGCFQNRIGVIYPQKKFGKFELWGDENLIVIDKIQSEVVFDIAHLDRIGENIEEI